MRSALDRVGATVDLFPGSQLFLDRAIFTDYDVIFCDLMLPGMSGIDLLFEVRGKAPAVPFVIISGQAAVSDAIEAMKAGALPRTSKRRSIPDIPGSCLLYTSPSPRD